MPLDDAELSVVMMPAVPVLATGRVGALRFILAGESACYALGSMQLFRLFIPVRTLLIAVVDSLLVGLSYVVAYYVHLDLPVDPFIFIVLEEGLPRIGLVAVCVLLSLFFKDLYGQARVASKVELVLQLCWIIGICFIVQALLAYLQSDWILPQWVMITGSGVAFLALLGWRIFSSRVLWDLFGTERLLFLGISPAVEEVARRIQSRSEYGLTVVGFLDDQREPGSGFLGSRVLGPIRSLRKVAAEQRANRIIVGLQERRQNLPLQDLLELRYAGTSIEEVGGIYEMVCHRIYTRDLHPSQIIFRRELGVQSGSVALQSIYTNLIALAGILVLSPVLLLTAILVKTTSPGPVLQRYRRVGFEGIGFDLLRFRCTHYAGDERGRLTLLGRWLQRLHLDGLPQLFNLLRGEGSLVGPRPESPLFVRELTKYIPYYPQRHFVKPGLLTGWSQINSRGSNTIENSWMNLEYDLYYGKHVSPALDVYILLATLRTKLLSRQTA
jgi:lipopolysaccharide/colanic/teichoic acid biosynthesis glycosyltransferase